MPGGPLAHVCFLVRDLDQAIEDWTKILSVVDPVPREAPIVRQYWEAGDDVMEATTFVYPNGCEIQLLTAANGDGRWRVTSPSTAKVSTTSASHLRNLPEAVAERDANGVTFTSTEPARDPEMPWQAWTFVAPQSSHGAFVELAYPYGLVDGRWESGEGAETADSAS